MHVRHTQLYQMVDSRQQFVRVHRSMLGQGKELSFILYSGSRIDRKITMMHFVDNHIGRRFQRRTLIILPSFRVRCFPIDNSGTFSIHPDSMSINSRSIPLPFIIDFHIESIELIEQILVNHSCPSSILSKFHLHCFISMTSFTFIIKHQAHFFCCR